MYHPLFSVILYLIEYMIQKKLSFAQNESTKKLAFHNKVDDDAGKCERRVV